MGASRRRGASAAAEAVARFLESLVPEEALREADVRGTPRRVAEAFRDDLLDGYRCDPRSILRGAIPHDGHDLVAVTGIDFHAVCPHHLLPYRGTACIAYVPGGRVLGFGVLARLLDCFAHRLVIQEVLARQVADALVVGLGARGAACVLDAEQMCLTVRGERRREARTHSQAFAGEMDGDPAWERRVLRLAAGDALPAERPPVRPAARPAARTARGKGRRR